VTSSRHFREIEKSKLDKPEFSEAGIHLVADAAPPEGKDFSITDTKVEIGTDSDLGQ
jgi:hypothetical protein